MAKKTDKLILALPKGRILGEVLPLLKRAGIEPEPEFSDPNTRKLRFDTNDPGIEIIRVRAFDVATFVAFGAAHFGVAGSDVIMEFDYPELYAPLDLDIGKCRLSVAAPQSVVAVDNPARWSHVRVATKYPNLTHKHFARRGVQAECIKLNGAMELARRWVCAAGLSILCRPAEPSRRTGWWRSKRSWISVRVWL